MTGLGALCHALLNGPAEGDALQAAEAMLAAALAGLATGAAGPPPRHCASWRLPLPPSDASGPAKPDLLRALAPIQLLDGVWLARAAQPGTGHLAANGLLLRIYTDTVGLEHPAAAPPLRYRARLVLAGMDLPPLTHPRFFDDAGFPEGARHFALLSLVLRHRSSRRFPELLGYTLAHLTREPAPFDEPEYQALRTRHRRWAEQALACARAQGLDETRVAAGRALYIHAFTHLLEELQARRLAPPVSRETRMAGIVRAKLSQAQGYHRRVRLQGRSLDAWLAEHAENPQPLLRALRDSPLVDTACPASSRLLKAMDFGGPMFGVFDAREREIALGWIEDPAAMSRMAEEAPAHPAWPQPSSRSAKPARALRPRELYHAMLVAESPIDVSAMAVTCIRRMLRRTRLLGWLGLGTRHPARSPEDLPDFVEQQHRAELERYRPLAGPGKVDKAFCRWTLRQLAPAIFTDGAWLAGIPDAGEKLDDPDRELLKIFVDELGAGRADWHHANVYRRLLDSQRIRLPAFDSQAFAELAELVDAAFEIPAYLLAMGLATERYRPELLGLNLAIELSGLGAVYLRAIDRLRQHGMDPTIIQLHLSIDNPASGHAARARNAIQLYLEDLRRREGPVAVATAWRRVWLGHESLRAASLGLAIRIVWRYSLHRLGWRVPVDE